MCMTFPLFIGAVVLWPPVAVLLVALTVLYGLAVGVLSGFAPATKGYWGAWCEVLSEFVREYVPRPPAALAITHEPMTAY